MNDDVIELAAICYAKLPFMHKQQQQSSPNSSVDFWYSYFKHMLVNAHSILNQLFEDSLPIGLIRFFLLDFFSLDLNFISRFQENDFKNILLEQNHVGSLPNLGKNLFLSLNKDQKNLDCYFKRLAKRFRACCLSMIHLFSPLNDEVKIDVRPVELIRFLKRIFSIDFKKLVTNRNHLFVNFLVFKDLSN